VIPVTGWVIPVPLDVQLRISIELTLKDPNPEAPLHDVDDALRSHLVHAADRTCR
jgi:hypothetical protein